MRLYSRGFVRRPVRRARLAGVGLAVLGTVGLGLAIVPACGGGGGVGGEEVVHWTGSVAPAAMAVTGSVAPDCGGGGGVGSDD